MRLAPSGDSEAAVDETTLGRSQCPHGRFSKSTRGHVPRRSSYLQSTFAKQLLQKTTEQKLPGIFRDEFIQNGRPNSIYPTEIIR